MDSVLNDVLNSDEHICSVSDDSNEFNNETHEETGPMTQM